MVLVNQGATKVAVAGSLILGLLALVVVAAVAVEAALLAALAGIAAVIASAFIIPRMLVLSRWQPTELHFASWPLTLGSVEAMEIVRTAKRAAPEATVDVGLLVECVERVTYTVGSDTRTDTATVYSQNSTARGTLSAGTFRAQAEIEIPVRAGAPTMDLTHNEIEWKIQLSAAPPLPRHKATFTLVVAPTLAAVQPRIQDSRVQDT